MCDPVWHVSSCSGVATLRTAIHLLLTYLLTYLLPRMFYCNTPQGVYGRLVHVGETFDKFADFGL